MKKIFFIMILLLPAVIFAGATADKMDVTATAEIDGGYDPSKYPFNDLPGLGTMLCAHKNIPALTMAELNPADVKSRWMFKLSYKDKPQEIRDVIGLIEYTKVIDGVDYTFYGVPLENKGNLVRFTSDAAYIRNLKYPVFSLFFLDVQLEPQMKYEIFPMKTGDEWKQEAEGIVDVLGLFKVKIKTKTGFKVLAVEDVPVDGRWVHVYKVENLVERGNDGKISREVDWFGAGVGLMYIDTEAYILELQKYIPGPDSVDEFLKWTVPVKVTETAKK